MRNKMEYWDIEDYLEEIKYLLTEYDEMTEEVILAWEAKAREYIMKHNDGKKIKVKSKDDVQILIKDEQIFWDMALKYHNYVRKGMEDIYWKEFDVIKAY